jgi:hypothetical protein
MRIWLMLMCVWVGCYSLMHAAAGGLVIKRERENLCDVVEREREDSPPLESTL